MKRALSISITCVFLLVAVLLFGPPNLKQYLPFPSPQHTVSSFLNAAKKSDFEKMSSYIASDNAGDVSKLDAEDETEQYFLDYLKECLLKMSYEIKSTEVTGESAVVTVHFKYIDSSDLLSSVVKDVLTQGLSSVLSGTELTDEQQNAMFTDAIQKYRESAADTYVESTVDISCKKVDGAWLIDSVNDDLGNILTSNFISVTSPTPQYGSGVLGNYSVSIDDNCDIAHDYDGNPVAIVTYNWTNNSANATNFESIFNTQVFQNGVECDSAFLSVDYDSSSATKNIKPGTSFSVQKAYTLQDNKDSFDVEVTEFLSLFNNPPMVTQTFEFN
ncbi:hypothetical protein OBV_25520 [Oscillibacter valericigenes Sjm18-20]|nr:hypothetical protein OBV_25520 [Oscillibacter valericigenes Sjm18-20]